MLLPEWLLRISSDEGYTISNDSYYISVQVLDSEGMTQGEMPQELKNIASDDGVTEVSEVDKFDLHHFHKVKLEENANRITVFTVTFWLKMAAMLSLSL